MTGGGIIFRSTSNENYRLHVAVNGKYDLVNQEKSLLALPALLSRPDSTRPIP